MSESSIRPDPNISTSEYPSAEEFLSGLTDGSDRLLDWLRSRTELRAAPRFSSWAWEHIHDDFAADLVTQLTVTATRPDFALRGSPQAYIDVSIANLCGTYFRRLAELRRNDPLHVHHSSLQTGGEDALERIAVALEVRRLLRLIGENCQQLLRGKYLIGLSLQEMADAIGVHEPTVRARLHECRKRLRDLWLN